MNLLLVACFIESIPMLNVAGFELLIPALRVHTLKHYTTKLHCILHLERSRNQRQGPDFSSRKVDFTRWFPAAYLTNEVLPKTREFMGNIERDPV